MKAHSLAGKGVPRITRQGGLLLCLTMVGCAAVERPLDYRRLPLNADGSPHRTPYVVERTACGKTLVAVGLVHNRDPADPAWAELTQRYERLRPTLILHESVTPRSVEATPEAAILRNGAAGLLGYLARRDRATLVSADLPEAEEFRRLRARFPLDTLLVLLTGQRLLMGMSTEAEAASAYPGFYADYLVPNGLAFDTRKASWEGFKQVYRQVMGEDYSPARFEPNRISPIRDMGPLNGIARFLHRIRDQRILASVEQGLATNDRVMLVFGAWHILAIEAVLVSRLASTCNVSRELERPPA